MRRRGLSLAESVLSFFVVTLILILILNLFPTAIGSVRVAGQRMQAEALVDSILAEYRQKPFNQLVVGPPVVLPDRTARGTVLHPTVEIKQVKDSLIEPQLTRAIRVSVSWQDGPTRHQVSREVVHTRVYR